MEDLRGVKSIKATTAAFAALKQDGSVVAWGATWQKNRATSPNSFQVALAFAAHGLDAHRMHALGHGC